MPSTLRTPAAQYLRTSTLVQQWSMDTQRHWIQTYAEKNGFTIVRTYVDVGRSGLRAINRPGLASLIQDVIRGKANYQAILVYDVSRWGRFQDADESAHYEFLCKTFGAPVHYCKESFANDNEIPSSILKSLKRTMAAEYSREMSKKVFRGQKHIAELGFHVGAMPGYGFRRMAVTAEGSRVELLGTHEYKGVASDRVVLVLGPEEEVQCVRQIFAMALTGRMGFSKIASELNCSGISYVCGKPWRSFHVKRILTSEKYAGCSVWNKSSRSLQIAETKNPSWQWTRVAGAIPAIVDRDTFDRVQKVLPRGPRWTLDQILQRSRQAPYAVQTEITGRGGVPEPSWVTVRRRLRGERRLRSHRGTRSPDSSACSKSVRQRALVLRNAILDSLLDLFPETVAEFHLSGKSRPLLRLSNGLIVSVTACARVLRKTGILRWRLNIVDGERDIPTLVCLEDTPQPRYYMVPGLSTNQSFCSIGVNHRLLTTGFRLNDLSQFYKAASLFRALTHDSETESGLSE